MACSVVKLQTLNDASYILSRATSATADFVGEFVEVGAISEADRFFVRGGSAQREIRGYMPRLCDFTFERQDRSSVQNSERRQDFGVSDWSVGDRDEEIHALDDFAASCALTRVRLSSVISRHRSFYIRRIKAVS